MLIYLNAECIESISCGENKTDKIPDHTFAGWGSIKKGEIVCLEFNVDGDNSCIAFDLEVVVYLKRCVISADQIVMDIKYSFAASLGNIGDSVSFFDLNMTDCA